MRGRPPKRSLSPEQEEAAESFINGAVSEKSAAATGTESPSEEHSAAYPWQEEYVREDVIKGYSLRLPEPLYLKLKYVSQQTGHSMNALCKEAVRSVVEDYLRELD